jgi:hypothetical protein
MTTAIFTAEEFWNPFSCDLNSAQARVIIQSPFVSSRRLKHLSEDFQRLTKRGISVCVFIQQPRNWSDKPESLDRDTAFRFQEMNLAIQILRSWNVHVNMRQEIHEKLAVMDDHLAWEGSLNILSHNNTKEHMRRWDSPNETRSLINKHQLEDCTQCAHNQYDFAPQENKHLGQLIAAQRTRLKVSRLELAKQCRLAAGRIYRIERGSNTTVDSLFRMLRPLRLRMLLVPDYIMSPVLNQIKRLSQLGAPSSGKVFPRVANVRRE